MDECFGRDGFGEGGEGMVERGDFGLDRVAEGGGEGEGGAEGGEGEGVFFHCCVRRLV